MLKLIIVTSDLLSSKEIINQCIGKINSLQLIAILTSKIELEYYQKNFEFDVIIFHDFDYINTQETYYDIIYIDKQKIPSKNFEKRIALSEINSFKVLQSRIEKFIKKLTVSTISQRVTDTLLDLGFNFKHVGTKYIVDCVCYYYLHPEKISLENLEKNLFPHIARLNNTHMMNIKWSITRTINLMYQNHTTKSILRVEEYFFLEHMKKPTPKAVINVITTRILSDELPATLSE